MSCWRDTWSRFVPKCYIAALNLSTTAIFQYGWQAYKFIEMRKNWPLSFSTFLENWRKSQRCIVLNGLPYSFASFYHKNWQQNPYDSVPLSLPKQEEIVSDLGSIENIQTFPQGYFKVPHDVAQRNILERMFGYFQHSQDQIATSRDVVPLVVWYFACQSILYFPIPHNALCLPPKFCINYCCGMLLGICRPPKSISQQ